MCVEFGSLSLVYCWRKFPSYGDFTKETREKRKRRERRTVGKSREESRVEKSTAHYSGVE